MVEVDVETDREAYGKGFQLRPVDDSEWNRTESVLLKSVNFRDEDGGQDATIITAL